MGAKRLHYSCDFFFLRTRLICRWNSPFVSSSAIQYCVSMGTEQERNPFLEEYIEISLSGRTAYPALRPGNRVLENVFMYMTDPVSSIENNVLSALVMLLNSES